MIGRDPATGKEYKFRIDAESSSFVDLIWDDCFTIPREVGMIRRGRKTKTSASPDLYYRGIGEEAVPVARVWPKGWEPSMNPTPHIPFCTAKQAMEYVADPWLAVPVCETCAGPCDFGQRGDGPAEQDESSGLCYCGESCLRAALSSQGIIDEHDLESKHKATMD